MSNSINDIVLRIHMTFLNNKRSVDWISSFKDEIAPLDEAEFHKLIDILHGISEQEQANFADAIMHNNIPAHLQQRAGETLDFTALIEKLQAEYARWKS